MKKENLTPYNNKGQQHGYWELFYHNGDINFKGNYFNNKQSGYWEIYNYNTEMINKVYFIL